MPRPRTQAAAALILLAIAWYVGHAQIDLLARGARASGRIVAYQAMPLHDGDVHRSSDHALVEFQVGASRFRFVDRLGGANDGQAHTQVTVRYLPDNPTVAMIDRPAWNWIPWGPAAAIGVLVLLSAIIGFIRDRRRTAQHAAAPSR